VERRCGGTIGEPTANRGGKGYSGQARNYSFNKKEEVLNFVTKENPQVATGETWNNGDM